MIIILVHIMMIIIIIIIIIQMIISSTRHLRRVKSSPLPDEAQTTGAARRRSLLNVSCLLSRNFGLKHIETYRIPMFCTFPLPKVPLVPSNSFSQAGRHQKAFARSQSSCYSPWSRSSLQWPSPRTWRGSWQPGSQAARQPQPNLRTKILDFQRD